MIIKIHTDVCLIWIKSKIKKVMKYIKNTVVELKLKFVKSIIPIIIRR